MNKKERASEIIISMLKALAYVLVYFGAQIAVGFVLGFVVIFDQDISVDKILTEKAMEISILANMISVVCCLWLSRIMNKQGTGEAFRLNLDFNRTGKIIGLCLAIGVFGQYAVTFLLNAVIKFPDSWVEAQEQNTQLMQQGSFTAMFIAIAIVAPLAEEIIFRACFQGALQSHLPKWVAIAISSVAFGLMHGTPIGIIYATVLGVLMGWLFSELNSVLPSMIFHLGFNFTSIFITSLSPVIFIISILCFALAFGYLIYLCKKNRNEGDNNEAL